MKKLAIFGGVIVILFIAIAFLTNKASNDKLANVDNPYGTDNLQQATIDQLGDENYNNIILPDELTTKIESGEETFAYFFSPTCVHCQAFTPVLMPLAEQEEVEIDQFNVLEFDFGWETYNITATPTLIYFKDGKEVNRLEGNAGEDIAKQFLTQNF